MFDAQPYQDFVAKEKRHPGDSAGMKEEAPGEGIEHILDMVDKEPAPAKDAVKQDV